MSLAKSKEWLALVISILTIAGVIWKGGAIAQSNQVTAEAVKVIYEHGTPALQIHVQSSEQQIKAINQRLEKLEDTTRAVQELRVMFEGMRGDIKAANQKLDYLKETVEKSNNRQ